jgi:hypothetical protein
MDAYLACKEYLPIPTIPLAARLNSRFAISSTEPGWAGSICISLLADVAEVFRVAVAVAVNQHRYLEGRTTATNTVGQLAVTHTAMAEAITAAAREAEEYPEHTGRRVLIVIDHSSWSIGSVPGNNAYLRALLKNLIGICST